MTDPKSLHEWLQSMETKILAAEQEHGRRLGEMMKEVCERRYALEKLLAPPATPPAPKPAAAPEKAHDLVLSWAQIVRYLEESWLLRFIPNQVYLAKDGKPCSEDEAVALDYDTPLNIAATRTKTLSCKERGDWGRHVGKRLRGPNTESDACLGLDNALLVGRLLQEVHCLNAPMHTLAVPLMEKVRAGKVAPASAYKLLAKSRSAFFRAKNGRSLTRSYVPRAKTRRAAVLQAAAKAP